MRKIVQIAAHAESEATYAAIYALADDGTLWMRLFVSSGGFRDWQELPELPQPDAPEVLG